jgi:hypothetical protein
MDESNRMVVYTVSHHHQKHLSFTHKNLPSLIPDDGGSTHLWNVGRQSFYTAVQPRRQLWTELLYVVCVCSTPTFTYIWFTCLVHHLSIHYTNWAGWQDGKESVTPLGVILTMFLIWLFLDFPQSPHHEWQHCTVKQVMITSSKIM